ncbi:hypothetical protein DFJ74DRAFT_647678 [Hyaloraphidium curvatum]|nr:hypothetical protein DFJ74DRAFT_647678 [Hyaloraphidium curvatum]
MKIPLSECQTSCTFAEAADPNRKAKRTGTGAWVGDVDKISEALRNAFEHMPDETIVVSIDPGVKRPMTGVRATLGELRKEDRLANGNHPLEGMGKLDSFSISANNVRKHTKARRQAEETTARLEEALGSRAAFTDIGTPKTLNQEALANHLGRVFAILDRVWEVTLSDAVAHRRWQAYIAQQVYYAKKTSRQSWRLVPQPSDLRCVAAFRYLCAKGAVPWFGSSNRTTISSSSTWERIIRASIARNLSDT